MFNSDNGTTMLQAALREDLHDQAPALYERTGGNSLEIAELVKCLRKADCRTPEQLDPTVTQWFRGRVAYFTRKLLGDCVRMLWSACRSAGVQVRPVESSDAIGISQQPLADWSRSRGVSHVSDAAAC